jgi:hypothetical protein
MSDNEQFFKDREAADADVANRPSETLGVVLFAGLGGLVGAILAVSMGAEDMNNILGTAAAGALIVLAVQSAPKI